jgi:hypothetical protein
MRYLVTFEPSGNVFVGFIMVFKISIILQGFYFFILSFLPIQFVCVAKKCFTCEIHTPGDVSLI